jgi:hypothetical protein
MRPVPVKPQYTTIMHGNNQLVWIDNRQAVRMLKPKPWRRPYFDCIPKRTAIVCRPLLEVIRPQRDRVELVRLVNNIDA